MKSVFIFLSILLTAVCAQKEYVYDPILNYSDDLEEYEYDESLRISYKFHSVPMTWLNAKLTCFEEGGRLTMPKNSAEATAIVDLLTQHDPSGETLMFLDSHDYFEHYEFITQDYYLQYFFHTWAPGEPNVIDGHCLVMNNDTRLESYQCDSRLPFICQKNDVYSTKGDLMFERTNYPADPRYRYDANSRKFLKLHMHTRTWSEARAICNAEGGRLAIIESKNQETFMTEMFNDPDNIWPDSEPYAFIGFHDMYRSRLFYTVADQNLNEVGYVNWGINQPDNVNERCGAVRKSNGRIYDYSCTDKLQFFCERKYTI